MEYDAANRLVKVKDAGNTVQSFIYGATNARLVTQEGNEQSNNRTYYAWSGGQVLAEFVESSTLSTTPSWSKSYIFLGNRLLSTATPNGTSTEIVQYHHLDRLGTRLISNAADTNVVEQVTLPFGTALANESTGASNRRFTSYERSTVTGLDYAVNRHYDSQQGRFTQADPIGTSATSLADPQSLNLFSYCANDPVNRTDPAGLFWGKLFGWIGKSLKAIMLAVGVAMMVIALVVFPGAGLGAWFIAKYLMLAGSLIATGSGAAKVGAIIGFVIQGIGIYQRPPDIIRNFQRRGTNSAVDRRKAPLSGWRLKFYLKLRQEAREQLISKECRDYLTRMFPTTRRAKYADVLDALDRQTPYNAFKSTIEWVAAGLGKASSPNAGHSVSHWVYGNPTARYAATAAATIGTRYDVYFGDFSAIGSATLIHEALHSATLLNDGQIMAVLFPNEPYQMGDITQALSDHGCGSR